MADSAHAQPFCTRAAVSLAFGMVAPLVVAVVYVVRYEQAFYVPYDMTALLLFNGAVYLSIRGNLWLYLLTILVAMFHREATVFVLFVWIACNWRQSRVKAAIGAVLTAVYGV